MPSTTIFTTVRSTSTVRPTSRQTASIDAVRNRSRALPTSLLVGALALGLAACGDDVGTADDPVVPVDPAPTTPIE